MKHSAPADFAPKIRPPVSIIPMHRRKDLEHILRGVECGLRRTHAATVPNMARYFACCEGQARSAFKRLVDEGYMADHGGALILARRGSIAIHGEEVAPPLPPVTADDPIKRSISSIDVGGARSVARRYEALAFIAANPGATIRQITSALGYPPTGKSTSAVLVQTLARLGLITRVEATIQTAVGKLMPGHVMFVTAKGKAVNAAKKESATCGS